MVWTECSNGTEIISIYLSVLFCKVIVCFVMLSPFNVTDVCLCVGITGLPNYTTNKIDNNNTNTVGN